MLQEIVANATTVIKADHLPTTSQVAIEREVTKGESEHMSNETIAVQQIINE